jgi:hypothetical protein
MLAELQRAHSAILLGNRRPDKHGALGHLYWPAETLQALHQHVTPLLVHIANHLHFVLELTASARSAVRAGRLADFKREALERLANESEEASCHRSSY